MLSDTARRIVENVKQVIVGRDEVVELAVIALLCEGHVLIEDVPGIGKTTLAKTVARSLGCSFQRIQFTPDLLPSDVTGIYYFNQKQQDFEFRAGPVMAQVVLADEINRATPRTQAALLEAMQERQVTIGENTFPLDEPFMVLATQNPIEQEGTYPLPEAQVDRFMLKLKVNYPTKVEEREIMDRVNLLHDTKVSVVVTRDEILRAREVVNQIYVDDKAKNYIVDLVQATRNPEAFGLTIKHLIEYGASPRATIYLQQAARALAFLQGEGNVFPNDVKQVAMDILRHRVIVTYEAEAENMTSEDIIRRILDTVPVP